MFLFPFSRKRPQGDLHLVPKVFFIQAEEELIKIQVPMYMALGVRGGGIFKGIMYKIWLP